MQVYILFYKRNVYEHKFKHKLSITSNWKLRKYLSALTILLLSNSTDFAKVYTTEINHNALIVKISTYKKHQTFQNRQKKKQSMKNKSKDSKCFISFRQMSWGEITSDFGMSNKHLCMYFYVDSTISSIL